MTWVWVKSVKKITMIIIFVHCKIKVALLNKMRKLFPQNDQIQKTINRCWKYFSSYSFKVFARLSQSLHRHSVGWLHEHHPTTEKAVAVANCLIFVCKDEDEEKHTRKDWMTKVRPHVSLSLSSRPCFTSGCDMWVNRLNLHLPVTFSQGCQACLCWPSVNGQAQCQSCVLPLLLCDARYCHFSAKWLLCFCLNEPKKNVCRS